MDSTTTQTPPTPTAEAGIDIAKVTATRSYTDWIASLDLKRFTVKAIHLQSVDMFGRAPNEKVGFIKLKADVVDSTGKFIAGIVFMRGGSVGILPVLKCEGKKYTVATVQPRIATGSFEFVEIPAGMLDGSGNFAGLAAKELDEELGLKIAAEDLIDLSTPAGHPKGFFVSPGGTEETLRLFYFERHVTTEELAAFHGKATGLIAEGEQITLKVMPLEDLWQIPDGKTLVAISLYERLQAATPAQ